MYEKKRKKLPDNWEKELGKFETKHSVPTWLEGNMDRYSYETFESQKEVEFGLLFSKVLGYGLTRMQAQVVCLKVCFCWSLADIAVELKIPHRQTVHMIYKKSLEILREAGYKK